MLTAFFVFPDAVPWRLGWWFSFEVRWWLVSLTAAGVVIAAHLLLVRISRRATDRGQHTSRLDRGLTQSRHFLFAVRPAPVFFGILIVLPPAGAWYRLATPVPIPDTPLPKPNGYDELLELGSVIDEPRGDAPAHVLQSFVTQHGPVLDRARLALARKSAVPVNFLDTGNQHTWVLVRLGRTFVAEGRLAEQEGNVARAAGSYLDCVRLGQAAARGGVVIDWARGLAIEQMAISRLSEIHHKLSMADCRQLAQDLAAIEAAREPLEPVLVRDRAQWHHASGWEGRLELLFEDLTGESRVLVERGRLVGRASMRLAVCDLSIRAFQLENRKLPRELDDLVPEYLPSVPEDPFSGGPLVYRVQADGYILYSVGRNRQDDGGRPQYKDGDLRLGM